MQRGRSHCVRRGAAWPNTALSKCRCSVRANALLASSHATPPRHRRPPTSLSDPRPVLFTLAVLGGMIVLFLWDRLRYDLVALLALLAAVLGGIVHADHAFSGFSNPVVPLIAGALIVSAAIARSGAVEVMVRWLTPLLRSSASAGRSVGRLRRLPFRSCKECRSAGDLHPGCVSGRAAKRPLALRISDAAQLCLIARRLDDIDRHLAEHARPRPSGRSSKARPSICLTFSRSPSPLALCGVVFLSFGWRLIPLRRRPSSAEAAFKIEDYTSELSARAEHRRSPAGRWPNWKMSWAATSRSLLSSADEYRRYVPSGSWDCVAE